jgi:choline oxidase
LREKSYDYIVIGGGTAGSIVAARLAEDPNRRVALLEAGPSDENNPLVLQADQWMAMLGTKLDYDYIIEPQPRSNSTIRHSRGKVLGGCSSHNSCIAFRTPDADLDYWEATGSFGWGPDATAPYFDRLWQKIYMAEPPGENPLNEALINAASQTGIPRVAFPQDGSFKSGAGILQLNIKDGIRQSSSVAYLHPLDQLPPNLEIVTNVVVYRILLDSQDRAIGVSTSLGPIYADGEVILCAGAFNSPQLLLLSGIGPADHLRQVGVPVRVALPGVGENLLDHPESVVIWESTEPIPAPLSQGWEVGIFKHTGLDDFVLPDLMFHFGLMPFDWNTLPMGYPTAEHAFSLTPNVCRARSQGRVQLRTNHPADVPRIDFCYFTDPTNYDERVLIEGVKIAREIAAQPALRDWIKRELAPGPDVQDDEAISDYVRRTANTVYHPAGTCKMGAPLDPMAVVDPELRVLGVEGLRVADASIFPSITTVNPAITVMMIGERCAAMVASEETMKRRGEEATTGRDADAWMRGFAEAEGV